ncbi:MAG: hypothetical protein HY751_01775 [Nitrospinae bacterium]|nr:hypothetical protein [Nitrospinota bacterium]
MKNLMATLITVLISVVICFGFLEMASRVMYARKMDYQVEMSKYAATVKRASENYNVGHEHKPNQHETLMGVDFRTNSHGFRGAEYPVEKPAGVYRVMLLGDSLTVGWGAKEDSLFATRLEAALKDHFSKTGRAETPQVINTGVGNYNTDQEISFFEWRGKAFKPDLVVLNYFINDAEPTPRQKSPLIIKYSYLAMWLWGRIDTFERMYLSKEDYGDYYSRLYDDKSEGWIKTKEAMGRLAALSKKEGFKVVVALLPELHAVGPKYGFQDIYDKVALAAKEAGIEEVVDLSPKFANEKPETLWVSPDDAHPNEKAHGIIANGLYEYLTAREVF